MVWAPESHFDRHLPFTLLTGFLGSGKTTLLNWLLRQPRLDDTAVVVNEFGAIPLDHLFLDAAIDDVMVLPNGCMCCFATDDLEGALTRLFERRVDGQQRRFKRLIVETSGLADPEFVLQSVLASPFASRFLWLDRIIATVDAVHGLSQLDKHSEASKQAKLADKLIITKTDLAQPAEVETLQGRLSSINDRADQLIRQDRDLKLEDIFSRIFLDETDHPSLLSDWFLSQPDLAVLHEDQGATEPAMVRPVSASHSHNHQHGGSADRVVSVTLVSDVPVPWREFDLWMGRLQRELGDRLLRIKGIVNAKGSEKPIVVHAVQSTLHVPVALTAWPDGDRNTRLVFITIGDCHALLEDRWTAFLTKSDYGSVK